MLRDHIYDHSYIGVPFRRLARRSSMDEQGDDFKAISSALLEAANPVDTADFKDKFKSTASRHLGWTFAEINLHFELFAILVTSEERQQQPLPPDLEGEEDSAFRRLLRFALFLCLQLNELRHAKRRSSLDSFNIAAPFEFDGGRGQQQQTSEDLRVHLVVEARKTEKLQRVMFMQQKMLDILTLLCKMERCVLPLPGEEGEDGEALVVSEQVKDALMFLLLGPGLHTIVGKRVTEAAAWLSAKLAVGADEDNKSLRLVRGVANNDLVLLPSNTTEMVTTTCTLVTANHSATVVCLEPAVHSHVLGCFDCLVVLGPSGGLVTVEHCERVRVVGSCDRLRLINCTDCQINVWTGTRPIIADCRGMVLGPFNAKYPGAKLACQQVCPSIANNKWKRPLSCDAGMGLDDDDLNLCIVQPVEDFMFEPIYAFFPNQDGGEEAADSPPPPVEYQNQLLARKQAALQGFDLISRSRNPDALNLAVQQAFCEWLLSDAGLAEGLGWSRE